MWQQTLQCFCITGRLGLDALCETMTLNYSDAKEGPGWRWLTVFPLNWTFTRKSQQNTPRCAAVQLATECSQNNKNLNHASLMQLSVRVLLTERPFFLQERLQQQQGRGWLSLWPRPITFHCSPDPNIWPRRPTSNLLWQLHVLHVVSMNVRW